MRFSSNRYAIRREWSRLTKPANVSRSAHARRIKKEVRWWGFGRLRDVTHFFPSHMTRSPQFDLREVDPESFVREHQAGVWRYLRLLGASGADAEDLLQETLLAFLRKSSNSGDPQPLLRTIARGLWIDRQRWLARRRAVEWAEQLDAALVGAPSDPHLEGWLDALAACREQLGERAQRALTLAYCEGLGRKEVASELGVAPNTARNLLAQARQVLRTCIEAKMTDGER